MGRSTSSPDLAAIPIMLVSSWDPPDRPSMAMQAQAHEVRGKTAAFNYKDAA